MTMLLLGDRTPLDPGYCPEANAVMSIDLKASGTATRTVTKYDNSPRRTIVAVTARH
jgi:hypothetical protein